MNFENFERIFERVKNSKPLWLEGEMEPLATEEQIYNIESELGVRLPEQYREFLKRIGAGYFGYINIFSANKQGEWCLLNKIKEFTLSEWFVPITDDETGGIMVLKKIIPLALVKFIIFIWMMVVNQLYKAQHSWTM